mgnify:CR=1 FL=1
MYLDPDTMLPINFDTYVFDLDHANQFDEPIWKKKYNWLEEYDLPDMSPKSFYDHSRKIFYNETAAV